MESISLKSYATLMNSSYERISEGKPYDAKMSPYSKEFVEKMIAYFEESEEFEKCAKLSEFRRSRFDHEKNYERQ